MATDDPEGVDIYARVLEASDDLIKRGDLILLTLESQFLVNALQRVSAVIIQKSLREGFGLTVAEAMWKQTPVVASRAGGIPLQIDDEENGFLVDPTDAQGFADRIVEIMLNGNLALKIGKKAKEKIRENFLITRLLVDYLDLIYYELYTQPRCAVMTGQV